MFRIRDLRERNRAACEFALEKARRGARRILRGDSRVSDVAQGAVLKLLQSGDPNADLGAAAFNRGRFDAVSLLAKGQAEEEAAIVREENVDSTPEPIVLTTHQQTCLRHFMASAGGMMKLENLSGKSMDEIARERQISKTVVFERIKAAWSTLCTSLGLDPHQLE